MKTIYKNSLTIALGMLVAMFTAMPASAQHNSGGGGGGSRPSGGGGGGGSAPSSGGGGGGSRPAYSGGSVSSARPASSGNVGYSRPSNSVGAPVRSSGNVGYAPRGNYGYAPRTGAPQGNYGYAQRNGVANGVPRQSVNGVGAVRGNYGMAPRYNVATRGPVSGVGSNGVSAYRNSPRVGYNGGYNGGGYWGNHGYNYYNRGYYNSYYLPRLGFTCAVLPYGYYPFYFGDYQYYYSDGLYYQYDNNQYTVVEPPVGAEVTSVPDKAQSIVINGQQYYELNGVYYQAVTKDDGTVTYQIAGKDGTLNTNTEVQDNQPQGPQMGDIVVQLPQDCRKIKVNGQKLYVSPDGVYYQEQVDANGAKSYKVVGLPTDEPAQN